MAENMYSHGYGSDTETVRYKRVTPPANYLLKIESFSFWLKSKVEKIESGIFEAGGYKWRMVLYPSGNTKSNGKDHISLYLAIEETNSRNWKLDAELKLFVFDHNSNNYLTVQGIKRFHDSQTKSGFSKFIPLETFKDVRKHGYLSHDSCLFGAEVLVIKPSGEYECHSMVKQPANGTLTWKLTKFSKIETNFVHKKFTVDGRNWEIQVYPKGSGEAKGDWLSVFLELSDTLSPKRKVSAEYKLQVLDQRRNQLAEKTGKHWYTASNKAWGTMYMIRLEDLHKKLKGLNDTLIVEAYISVISVREFLQY